MANSSRPKSRWHYPLIAAGVVACLAAGYYGFQYLKAWRESRPHWELTAVNTQRGLSVQVFESDSAQPTYSFILQGRTVPREFHRIDRPTFEAAGGETTFADDTFKPGRWALLLDGAKIDIMPARMVIDDEIELAHAEPGFAETQIIKSDANDR